MAARLKVFVTSDGLTDFVVASTSKAKALAAWGSHQDLFQMGLAHETDDPDLAAAATATPGEVLRRPAGTRSELAKMRPAPPAAARRGPTKAALRKVRDLEKKLAELDAAYEAASQKLEAQRAALGRKAVVLQAQFEAEYSRWERALAEARKALQA